MEPFHEPKFRSRTTTLSVLFGNRNKRRQTMDNMLIKSLKDILFFNTQRIHRQYKNTKKMMFPNRSDLNLSCSRPSEKDPNSFACKLLRLILVMVLFCLFIVFFNSYNHLDEPETPKKEDAMPPIRPPPCKIEIGEKLKEEIKTWIQNEIQHQNKACSKSNRISSEQMRSMVKEEIKRQQKIQLKPDFASASAGGMVLEASPTWTEGYSYIYFLFIPIRSTAPPPSIILEPTRQAGDCWPMAGHKGNLLIQLAARANIVGFTMEHIDPAMSLSGGTPEAPNNFSVYGVELNDHEKKRHLFGMYSYNNKNDEESQYFRVQNINRKSFLYILVEITSNHGNDKYTCIYRFQVHGFIDRVYHCET